MKPIETTWGPVDQDFTVFDVEWEYRTSWSARHRIECLKLSIAELEKRIRKALSAVDEEFRW